MIISTVYKLHSKVYLHHSQIFTTPGNFTVPELNSLFLIKIATQKGFVKE